MNRRINIRNKFSDYQWITTVDIQMGKSTEGKMYLKETPR
jgi:hypothetical protein